MAKEQNLPLNPLKISGICGRLMCCLRYEYESYQEFIDKAPEVGVKVKSSHGYGIVCGYEPLKESLVLYLENSSRKSVLLSEVEITNERVELNEFGEPCNMDHVKTKESSEDKATGIDNGDKGQNKKNGRIEKWSRRRNKNTSGKKIKQSRNNEF